MNSESGPQNAGDILDFFLDIVFGHERKSKPWDDVVILACFVEDRPA
jgi:hypothetical protein